jgi:DNA-binding NarL/FixJ family response regulator
MRQKKTVLIVDDNKNFVARMTGMLTEHSPANEVVAAHSVAEAGEKITCCNPDVVLLDINLPDKSGIQFLKDLRAKADHRKVIMLTNYSYDYYRHQCHELGVEYFLDKSNDFNAVPGILAAC